MLLRPALRGTVRTGFYENEKEDKETPAYRKV